VTLVHKKIIAVVDLCTTIHIIDHTLEIDYSSLLPELECAILFDSGLDLTHTSS